MRLRVGSYRVLFNVKSDIIEVMDIGPRGDVYK
jgi:mRNA-degrading endonuclease RelE of RelBE toxin-antitoxin system